MGHDLLAVHIRVDSRIMRSDRDAHSPEAFHEIEFASLGSAPQFRV